MSDNENSTNPSKQTSSVPLKKETVRVSLNAADAPASPSPTVLLGKPAAPPTPAGAPRPAPTVALRQAEASSAPKPAPTIALRASGAAGAPKPAPTIALRASGAPQPAPTIRLSTSNSPLTANTTPAAATNLSSAPTSPLKAASPMATTTLKGATPIPTAPLKAASPSIPLPQATIKLQPPTKPLGPAVTPKVNNLQIANDDDDDAVKEPRILTVLAGVGLFAAVLLLTFQLMLANVWINVEDNPNKGQWGQIFE
jgi:hypothetical protein